MALSLEVKSIAKEYVPGRRAVDGVDLRVSDGEMVVLVGPSGCGKTTLLRLVAGLEEPTAGRIILRGVDVTNVPPGKRDIAMVFQNYSLYPFKTVYENLAFGLRVRRVPKLEIDRLVRDTSGRLSLDALLDRYPSELSGGQQQRVALGRATIRKPRLFLFDEPLSSLDANLRRGLRQEIKRLQRESGTAALYVTHDQEEAMSLGDRLCVMREGALLQMATPKEIYTKPSTRFVAEFFGSPPMNFLTARLAPDVHGLSVVLIVCDSAHKLTDDLNLLLEQFLHRSLLIGFRPESVVVGSTPQSGLSLELRVTLLEDFGEHIIVSFAAADGQSLVGRLPPSSDLREGDSCHVQVPFKECLWFQEDGVKLGTD